MIALRVKELTIYIHLTLNGGTLNLHLIAVLKLITYSDTVCRPCCTSTLVCTFTYFSEAFPRNVQL